MPSWTRPARPRRCFAEAFETQTSSRHPMRRSTRYRSSLTRPESITTPTSSIVTLVSATLVASTTLMMPAGGRMKTRRCSSGGSEPCSCITHSRCSSELPSSRVLRSAVCTAAISCVPGRKTSTAEPFAAAVYPPGGLMRSSNTSSAPCTPPPHPTYHLTRSTMSCTLIASISRAASASCTPDLCFGNRFAISARVGSTSATAPILPPSAALRALRFIAPAELRDHSAWLSTRCCTSCSASSR
mmetsp:Transcript_32759/g.77634  ORF Transcript_32759/g.77634 Transcript_32759/m.77634 type:complete len:243 (-) Transcript_32759:493-1221(-)